MSPDLAPIVYAGIGDEAGPGLADQVAATRRLGWDAIELRSIGGVAIADLDDAEFRALAATLRSEGIGTVCVDSRIANWGRPITGRFENDLAELDTLASRCAELGTRFVRIMSYPNDGLDESTWRRTALERIKVLTERAERAGLVLLHENCAGWAGRSAERMLTMVETVASPSLRLLFDTGNGVAYGYEAYELLKETWQHVAHVHVKDADGDASAPVYVLPGTGRVRVADCLKLLFTNGYSGALSIEPHIATRPHEDLAATRNDIDAFVEYGRRLMELVRLEVLPQEALR